MICIFLHIFMDDNHLATNSIYAIHNNINGLTKGPKTKPHDFHCHHYHHPIVSCI